MCSVVGCLRSVACRLVLVVCSVMLAACCVLFHVCAVCRSLFCGRGCTVVRVVCAF